MLILRNQCDFLIQVKGNCSKLFSVIQQHVSNASPLSTYESHEKGHGRMESRCVQIYAHNKEAKIPRCWRGIRRLIKVRRWGLRNGEAFENTSFYILSKPINSAQVVAKAIRGHWGIENGLHWVKDVHLGEDQMSITHPRMATIVAFFNTIALNLIRSKGYKPVKDTFVIFTNKVKELYDLFQFSLAK
jgi:Transposase DDE domain